MVRDGDPIDAAAVREIDLHNTYKYGRKELADRLGITTTQCKALRAELGIEHDDAFRHDFPYGNTPYRQYSEAALGRMRAAIQRGVDWETLIARHRNRAA
jgi:hypothetical protein